MQEGSRLGAARAVWPAPHVTRTLDVRLVQHSMLAQIAGSSQLRPNTKCAPTVKGGTAQLAAPSYCNRPSPSQLELLLQALPAAPVHSPT